MGKGGKERYIKSASAEVLGIKKLSSKCRFFFLNNCGSRYMEQSIRSMLKNIQNQLASKGISPYICFVIHLPPI